MPAASARVTPALAPEDWRILRTLAVYRLVLVFVLIAAYTLGFAPYFLESVAAPAFFRACLIYAAAAIALLPPAFLATPGLRTQTYVGFATDALALVALVYIAKGISSGFGVLLITPAVGCSLILSTRMALLCAALASVLLFVEEFLRQSAGSFDGAATTETGLVGLMLFGTVVAANAVAGRARLSEALAERVGVDLANLSQLNERIIESMETGVLVLDEQRRIRLLNLAAHRLLGVAPGIEGSLLGERLPDLAAALRRWEQNPNLGGESIAPAGGLRQVIPRFMQLGGNPAAPILCLLDDAARLSEQAQQIKLAALGRLSAGIAHEIRNPLSAIQHAGQLLAESAQLETQDRRLLEMIQRHGVRIDKIVQDVMSVSRREAVAPAELGLRKFLERTLALYREAHPGATRPIEMSEVPAGLKVRFDPNHLQQILHNLWDNSFTHGGRAVQVRLRAGRASGAKPAARAQVFLDIADDGSGIPERLRDKIFEPFFTTAHKGTGLGLYLARELCDYNHGHLEYVSKAGAAGGGACFRLSFAP